VVNQVHIVNRKVINGAKGRQEIAQRIETIEARKEKVRTETAPNIENVIKNLMVEVIQNAPGVKTKTVSAEESHRKKVAAKEILIKLISQDLQAVVTTR
jgi:hypothetical protein